MRVITKRHVLDLPSLGRLILKNEYCPKQMSRDEVDMMNYSLEMWRKKTVVTELEDMQLTMIDKFLDKVNRGKIERRKELFSKHKIDYRKFHRLPEAMRGR